MAKPAVRRSEVDDDLIYPSWSASRLAQRVLDYSDYVGCGCPGGRHNIYDPTCARADFQRIGRELRHRARRAKAK